jgi:uncharacterized protein
MPSPRPLREVAVVYVALALATFAITRLRAVPAMQDYVHLLVAVLFLFTALRLAQREPAGPRRHGIDLAGLLSGPHDDRPAGPLGIYELLRSVRAALPAACRETLVALAVALVIFPPFAAGFYLWHRPARPFVLDLPPEMLSLLLAHLLVVALPEEALFRGYFQTRMTDAWPRTVRLAGAHVSVGALAGQAALFGGLHLMVDLDPHRFAVFFPGLLFGWLRAWRGGIGAAAVLHASSNVYIDVLVRGWT